jgi:hypothetical protein
MNISREAFLQAMLSCGYSNLDAYKVWDEMELTTGKAITFDIKDYDGNITKQKGFPINEDFAYYKVGSGNNTMYRLSHLPSGYFVKAFKTIKETREAGTALFKIWKGFNIVDQESLMSLPADIMEQTKAIIYP